MEAQWSVIYTNNTSADPWQSNEVWIGDRLPYNELIPYTVPEYYPEKIIHPTQAIQELLEQYLKGENTMNIYDIIVVDRKECTVLTKQENIVSKDEKSAMLELNLSKEIKAKVKKDEVEFIFTTKGSFEKKEDKE